MEFRHDISKEVRILSLHFADRATAMSDKRLMIAVMEVVLLRMIRALVAILFLLFCASAQGTGGGVLTLDEALQLAKSNNRDLKQFGFDIGKQREALGEV